MCRSQTTTWILEEKHCSFKVCFYMSAEHFDIKAQRTSRDRQNNILQQFGMEILQFAFVYPGKCHKHRLNLLPAFTQNAFLHITVVGNLTSFSWRMNGHPTMLETTYLWWVYLLFVPQKYQTINSSWSSTKYDLNTKKSQLFFERLRMRPFTPLLNLLVESLRRIRWIFLRNTSIQRRKRPTRNHDNHLCNRSLKWRLHQGAKDHGTQ